MCLTLWVVEDEVPCLLEVEVDDKLDVDVLVAALGEGASPAAVALVGMLPGCVAIVCVVDNVVTICVYDNADGDNDDAGCSAATCDNASIEWTRLYLAVALYMSHHSGRTWQ